VGEEDIKLSVCRCHGSLYNKSQRIHKKQNSAYSLQKEELGKEFWGMTPTVWYIKEKKSINWTWPKVKTFAL
jgi:hypothetical protein